MDGDIDPFFFLFFKDFQEKEAGLKIFLHFGENCYNI